MPSKQTITKKIRGFFGAYPPLSYPKGHILIYGTNPLPPLVYYLEKGHVGQIKTIKGGREIMLNIFKSGSFFPLVFALGKTSNQYDFAALDHIDVRPTPLKDVLDFVQTNPDVFHDFTHRISRGLVGLLNHLETLIGSEAQDKIISTLTTYAKRFGKKEKEFYKIELSLTHKTIANHLGLSRETVTRELTKLIRKQIIEKRGKYYFLKRGL